MNVCVWNLFDFEFYVCAEFETTSCLKEEFFCLYFVSRTRRIRELVGKSGEKRSSLCFRIFQQVSL